MKSFNSCFLSKICIAFALVSLIFVPMAANTAFAEEPLAKELGSEGNPGLGGTAVLTEAQLAVLAAITLGTFAWVGQTIADSDTTPKHTTPTHGD